VTTTRTDSAPAATSVLPKASAGTPVYVHLPFCAAKCHYCDFFSVAAEGQDIEGLLAAVRREIELRAPLSPRTVFLGGGTPSLLSSAQLRELLDTLQRVTGFRESASEVTIECNPESLSRDKARALLDAGVNRFSIGFQTLDDATLKLFGRVHSAEQSFRAYDAVRAAGATNVNVDFIYASPGQSLDEWRATLERVVALGTDHLSAYNLTFEEETPFRRWLEQGKLQKQPEELELEFFHLTRSRLSEAGLHAYEISNFARNGRACEHNLNYWRNGEYVGLGPSAVSKVEFTRGGNVKSVGDYKRRIAERENACVWTETPGPLARLGETWWLGLRLAEGLTADEALDRAVARGPNGSARTAATVERMAAEGWLEQVRGRWRLSAAGLPLADAVAREFLRLRDE
jgi:oxygen-independent coproporphyrinogen-3 oxidase